MNEEENPVTIFAFAKIAHIEGYVIVGTAVRQPTGWILTNYASGQWAAIPETDRAVKWLKDFTGATHIVEGRAVEL